MAACIVLRPRLAELYRCFSLEMRSARFVAWSPEVSMKIRAGYEISYDCPQPTPMILTLSVHPSLVPDLLSWDRMLFNPKIPANTYNDSFGNFCHVIRAPAGRLTMTTDFLVQDKGEPDMIAPQAMQHDLGDLPVEVLIYLLGSRYCETDQAIS